MSVQTSIEPTAEQLAIISKLELRARSAFMELDELQRAITALAEQGNPGAIEHEFLVGQDTSEIQQSLDNLRRLRITGGRAGFDDWFYYRIVCLRGVNYLVEEVSSDATERYVALLAVEKAVTERDPGMVRVINKAPHIKGFTDGEFSEKVGMTYPQLVERAEAVITKLIESGWRP